MKRVHDPVERNRHKTLFLYEESQTAPDPGGAGFLGGAVGAGWRPGSRDRYGWAKLGPASRKDWWGGSGGSRRSFSVHTDEQGAWSSLGGSF